MLKRLLSTSTKPACDVLIVGGGPAGLSMATALRNSKITQHLDVRLAEASDLSRLRNWKDNIKPRMFENRVSSITPRSKRFLESIGAWDHVAHERVESYDEMRVWDGISGAAIDFDPFVLGENENIAYMVENSNLQQALIQRTAQLGGVDFVQAKVDSITTDERGWPSVSFSNGEMLAARLLVGADGANSPVRTYAGIETRGWEYNRFGVVASLELEYDNLRSVAYQRFLPSGPLAMLPMPEGKSTMVWSTLPERAKWLRDIEPAAFVAMVNAGFRLDYVDIEYLHSIHPSKTSEIIGEVEWRLANTTVTDEDNSVPVVVAGVDEGTRAAFPMKMKHADCYTADRVAIVGDAAHSTHPLAGQGLNMGQRDVEFLMGALESAVQRGLDIGSPLSIEPFWKNAYLPNHLKIGIVDKLHALYGTDCWPVVQLRSFGLRAVNASEFIKRALMREASN